MRSVTALTWLLIAVATAGFVQGQDKPAYAGNGISFNYPDEWEIKETTSKDTDEIAVSSSKADAQITVIVVKKLIEGKEPLADAKKRVIDPWVLSLAAQYAVQKINLVRFNIKTEVGGLPTDGIQFKFFLDEQSGQIEICWALLEKRLILMYIVRPDRTAAAADVGWNLIRASLKTKAKEK